MKKIVFIIVGIVIFLVVTGFITKAIIEKVTRDITEREVRRIVGDRVTEEEIQRMTEQKTQEITSGILRTSSNTLTQIECAGASPQYSSNYYKGYLIDAHLHMPFTFDVPKALYAQADYDGAVLEKDVAAGSLICLLDKTKVKSAFGFYVIPNLLKGQALVQIKQIGETFPKRIIPFIMPAHVTTLNLKPSDVESLLTSHPGFFKGLGEIALYKDAYKGIMPDDESLRGFYDIAQKYNLVVMMHPDDGQREAVETILRDYPTVKFLFHGSEMRLYVSEIVVAYPNAFFTIDGELSDIQGEHQSVNLYGDKTKEDFIAHFNRDRAHVLADAIGTWKSAIEKNPDQYLWGTDRAYTMHFDEEVGLLLDGIAREFIGQLDPSVQEKFAYKNAEKIAGGTQWKK
ncbi:amidohydrolase family protein [Candidatus Woesearchaeota archaeon]|nr:amidohydrolase family protein [Candidatus Woesearchaeota archaeon]